MGDFKRQRRTIRKLQDRVKELEEMKGLNGERKCDCKEVIEKLKTDLFESEQNREELLVRMAGLNQEIETLKENLSYLEDVGIENDELMDKNDRLKEEVEELRRKLNVTDGIIDDED